MAVDDFRGLFAGDMGSSTGLFPFGDIYYQMQSLLVLSRLHVAMGPRSRVVSQSVIDCQWSNLFVARCPPVVCRSFAG